MFNNKTEIIYKLERTILFHSLAPKAYLVAFVNTSLSNSNQDFFLSTFVSDFLLLETLTSFDHLLLTILLTLVVNSLLLPSFSQLDPDLAFISLQFFLGTSFMKKQSEIKFRTLSFSPEGLAS